MDSPAGIRWGLSVDASFLGMSDIATINNTGLVMNIPVLPKLEELLINSTISAIDLMNAPTERIVQFKDGIRFTHIANQINFYLPKEQR